MSGPDQIPAPMYDGATQTALNSDIESELEDDNILQAHQQRAGEQQDVYARQALIRSQQELAAANAKVGQLEQTTSTLAQEQQYLKGQLDTLSTNSNRATQDAQRQADMQRFALTEAEKASYGESLPTVEKLIGKALYEQEQRLTAQFNQQLALQTQSAVDPLLQQVNTLKQSDQLRQQESQRSFDQTVKNAFAARGTTLEATLADPFFQAEAAKVIPGLGKRQYDVFKENAAAGNVDNMMAFVDHVMSSNPNASLPSVPSSNNTRTPTTQADAAKLSKRNELNSKLEAMENANSVGDYSKFGGSRTKFMEERNKILLEIERNPL